MDLIEVITVKVTNEDNKNEEDKNNEATVYTRRIKTNNIQNA